MKFSIYLNRRVFVMIAFTQFKESLVGFIFIFYFTQYKENLVGFVFISYFTQFQESLLWCFLFKIEKRESTSYKTIVLFILLPIDDFVSILFILTPSG